MTVREELDDLKFRLRLKTDEELAVALNTSKGSIDRWISRKTIPQKWRRIIELQFPKNVSMNINGSSGYFINGNNIKGGNYNARFIMDPKEVLKRAQSEDVQTARYLIERDPNNEYEDIDDIKERLAIRTNDEFTKVFQIDLSKLREIQKSGKIPQNILAAAHEIERKMHDLSLSFGGRDMDKDFAFVKFGSNIHEFLGPSIDIELIYMLTYANREFKEGALQRLKKIKSLSKFE
ncbi:hypothetical protein [uncultured Campylobacter sp.]|uniref:hypothetical protein n=1 Tax=uncultured Campylobacter sp. TaxID=218934 RepID=UPI00263568F1|nr:hypothetical protein [uncultured Campylobacter sp.]